MFSTSFCADTISGVFDRVYGDDKEGFRAMTRRVGSTERAGDNWREGKCSPRLREFMEISVECDEVFKVFATKILERKDPAARARILEDLLEVLQG